MIYVVILSSVGLCNGCNDKYNTISDKVFHSSFSDG